MPRSKTAVSDNEKQRMRAEIDDQVAEFLRRGGKINVLTNESSQTANQLGSVWHAPDDVNPLGSQ
ncbi:MAG: hypothetical protein AAGI24_10845 [Pseudomonadota bacterium]